MRGFKIDDEEDTNFLHDVIDSLVLLNRTDAEIINQLQKVYDPSCWFTVIGFAEQVIYG